MRASSTGNEENKWRRMREITNMTQKEFAEFIYTSKRNIENWENGSRNSSDCVYNLALYKVLNEFEKNKKISKKSIDKSLNE